MKALFLLAIFVGSMSVHAKDDEEFQFPPCRCVCNNNPDKPYSVDGMEGSTACNAQCSDKGGQYSLSCD